MPLIANHDVPARLKTTGRRFSTSAARCACSTRRSRRRGLDGVDGLLLTGGEDVDPPLWRSRRTRRSSEVEPERDAFEIALIAAARARDLPIFAHLPRRADPERRRRRHAGAGHPVAAARRDQSLPGGAAAPALRAGARNLGREGFAAGAADGRSAERDAIPARSTAGTIRRSRSSLPAFASRRRRRTASSRRSRIRPRRSASACSGIPKTSGAPASSGRCSKDSSRRHESLSQRRRTRTAQRPSPFENRHSFDVRRIRKQIERIDLDQLVAAVDDPPGVARERGDVARDVDQPSAPSARPVERLPRHAGPRRIDDHRERFSAPARSCDELLDRLVNGDDAVGRRGIDRQSDGRQCDRLRLPSHRAPRVRPRSRRRARRRRRDRSRRHQHVSDYMGASW